MTFSGSQQALSRYVLMLLFLTGVFFSLKAQNVELGNPPIRNYPKKVYAASPQNWQISQRKDGMMLFANNLGLLTYNGNSWQILPMTNHTIMRSVQVHPGGRIYVGGQGELGYFDQKNGTQLTFNDLTRLVPEQHRNFADVWNILFDGNLVFFQTFREVMIYNGSTMEVFRPGRSIRKLFAIRNRIYLQYEHNAYARYEDGRFISTDLLDNIQSDIVDVIHLKDGRTWIGTYKSGIYQLEGDQCRPIQPGSGSRLSNLRISALRLLSDGNILIGTANKGLFVVNPDLKILLSFSKENGLLNTTILATRQDRNGDIWAASESGIDFIEYKSPYRILFPDAPFNGTGYSAAILKGRLYLGTNNGLYAAEINNQPNSAGNPFREIPGCRDICWNLDIIDGKLWLGHNEGASLIEHDQVRPVFRGQGVWKFIRQAPAAIVFGAYEGFGMIGLSGSTPQAKLLKGFNESSRILLHDRHKNIWMSHPYRGVYKVAINRDSNTISTRLYGKANGLETNLDNYIIIADNRLYASNTNGIFVYDEARDRFHHDTTLERIIGFEHGTKLLSADPYLNIWYRKGPRIGFLEPKEVDWKKAYQRYLLPSLPESLAGGFEKVYPVSPDEFIFNCESGFLLFDKRKLSTGHQYKTAISKLSLLGQRDTVLINSVEPDDLIYDQGNPLILHHTQNNLRFEVGSFSYNDELVEYRYTLTGLDKGEAGWTSEAFVTYNNLSAGRYVFKVETRIGSIGQAGITTLYFEIRPAWYNSFLFRTSLLTLFVFGIIGLFLFQNRKFETEKNQMAQIHQAVVDQQANLVAQTEEEIMKLRNEQLQKDINFKNMELASIAMHLAHKKDFITTLETELKNIQKDKHGPAEVTASLKRIIHRLQQESLLDEDWERFTHYFDELHRSFITRLKERYPNLTTNDHRLCAYLRMDLSTKEIAALTNISTRGVEGSRYRLRKKMGLSNDDNLHEIMNAI